MHFIFREHLSENLNIKELQNNLEGLPAKKVLSFVLSKFGRDIAFASSMGAEDQVITSMVAGIHKDIKIFTLDTGRLFQETYDLIQKTNSRYNINIETVFPDARKVEAMVKEKGVNLFYESVENRKQCCHIRKIEPLKRALKGKNAWITGLRSEQAPTRSNIKVVEWDEANELIKINPLIDWTEEDVWDYIRENNVPYNKLHDKGFKSIGCLPCTKAVKADEDARAGRWWWENQGHKECGLHKR
ncbi:MAG: phosphoadenylyl-sulfate reductase [Bacteroidales bacterium]|nr:phosphoadenylyl-sulfate reductase [Bacteroidales bacterium]MCF8343742.1 phosphoadenylyl-sulfate reductase [Bacteroidales bacterium]MCF8349660.1 phosphoadenylyl-sulfate reductase [Bacteroidales bacterium]MCF8374906.1 phosphoadenylyl-sulfate reductase [Bacteroidales bacterium]MCF8400115.1 phosphoadenylyl-sulfate reductase [Bacteroidales bacterium]